MVNRVALLFLLAACGHPPPPAPPPAKPIASASASPVAAASSVAVPKPAPKEPAVLEMPEPKGECIVEGESSDAVGGGGAAFESLWVGDLPAVQLVKLDRILRIRVGFGDDPASRVAGVSVDTTSISIRGLTGWKPDQESRPGITFSPRTKLVREGWLEYTTVAIRKIEKGTITVANALSSWVHPVANLDEKAVTIDCKDLTPFLKYPNARETGDLVGTKVALEDQAGTKVATIDAPKPGRGVYVVETVKGRTKIRFRAGPNAIAEGWVNQKLVKKRKPNMNDFGMIGVLNSSTHPEVTRMTCETDVPLHVVSGRKTYAVGTLHAKQEVVGEYLPEGFALTLVGAVEPAHPFVPAKQFEASCTQNE